DQHPVEERADGDLRGPHLEHALGAEPAAMATGAAAIGDERERAGQERIAGLEDLDRSVAADRERRALSVVSVVLGGGAPADVLEVVVGVELARLGVDAAEQKIAAGGAVGGRRAFGYRF